MAVLRPTPIIPASKFSWRGTEGCTEASDLPGRFPSDLGRVYDDSCDVGFTMLSDRSGRSAVFCLDHVEKDEEGDLLFWRFRSVRRSHGADIPDMTVTVFND